MSRALAFLSVLLLLFTAEVSAQFSVELKVPRKMYIRYEPIVVSVTISNLSGRPMMLEDSRGRPWFSFHVTAEDGSMVPAFDPNYSLSPLRLGVGEKVKRAINLTPIYAIREFGYHRIQATVFSSAYGKYFGSNKEMITLTEGRLIWSQSAGVPPALADGRSDIRKVSLLTHRLPKAAHLYVRIEAEDAGIVYTTMRLGPIVFSGRPDVVLDEDNNINVLHLTAPQTYMFTKISLNGRLLDRGSYLYSKTPPRLRRQPDGSVIVKGGRINARVAHAVDDPAPKLSDRPVPLPVPGPPAE